MASSKHKCILVWFSLSEVKMATKAPAMFYLVTELSLSRHTSSHLTKSAYMLCLPSPAKRKRNDDSFYKIYLFPGHSSEELKDSLVEILQCQRQSSLDNCMSAAILTLQRKALAPRGCEWDPRLCRLLSFQISTHGKNKYQEIRRRRILLTGDTPNRESLSPLLQRSFYSIDWWDKITATLSDTTDSRNDEVSCN